MFSERIRFLRQSRALSQVQLAARLGVKKQSVSNWENDNIMPSVDLLVRIADFFDVSTDYLLGRSTPADGCRTLDVTGLTAGQIAHVLALVEDLRG